MKKILLSWLLAPTLLFAQLKSPEQFLGYKLGDQFTRHHQVVDYMEHLHAQSNNQTKLFYYGKTYEERPLLLLAISSANNIAQIDKIRSDNLKRAGLLEGEPTTQVPVIWLSYNVHGNESSSTEAAMATAYHFLSQSTDVQDWLDKSIILIDPCVNPDGRDRYVNFYWQNKSQPYDPYVHAAEHQEPWPGGRTNHYLFDLNRDWVWQSQMETKSRINVYNQWLPHIHVDFHEQEYNSPYYFAPAAQPYHELITQFQRDFQHTIGKNHAKYFDANHWLYFTKQRFDLLYPGYGDTYPTYNGSIGMTYEQAGGGRAGLGIIKQEKDTLTLADRIKHHFTTGISTVEVANQYTDPLLSEFKFFFNSPQSQLKYKSFVLKFDGNKDKFDAIKSWLDANMIRYGSVSSDLTTKGYDYFTRSIQECTVTANDLVVNTNQPKAVLAHILFEPDVKLVDSLTYDITAWGLPYAYGLHAFALNRSLTIKPAPIALFQPNEETKNTYVFICKWNSMQDARFLAALLKRNYKIRFTERLMQIDGKIFDRGSLILAKRDNKRTPYFEKEVTQLANKYKRLLTPIGTGFSERGPDVGSYDVKYLKKPKIALLSGEGTFSYDVGSTWHFMEQELEFPVTILRTEHFNPADLDDFDILIMQGGRYASFKEKNGIYVINWVENGGKLIVVKEAIDVWRDSEFTAIASYSSEVEKEKDIEKKENRNQKAKLIKYEDQMRYNANRLISGAVYLLKLDNTHPLAFGYPDNYYTLKTTNARNSLLKSQNVGFIEENQKPISGFVGKYVQQDMSNNVVFGVEDKGSGNIIFMADNPLFRSFWHNGKLLFVNALFFVGQ